MGFESGLVPCRAELSAATDVRENVDAAALEPELADDAGVAWSLGDLEAAVGASSVLGSMPSYLMSLRWTMKYGTLVPSVEVACKLFDDEVRGVELRRQRFWRVST